MQFGLTTFVEYTPDPITGTLISAHQRIRNLMEEVELAEEVGLDVFAIGEHHRPDFLASSPAILLAAAAEKTKKIRLSSAVTVLSSDDPVRVYQDFATIDLLSGGRAEIMAGRGSFIESFPLFGFDLKDYDELFTEKLELLLEINRNEVVDWKGNLRSSIDHLGIYPRAYQEKIPVWIAVGGTPQSVIRAAKLGLPLTLAIIGGMPEQFAPLINLYRETWKKNDHPLDAFQLAINTHAFIGEDSQKAADDFYPSYAQLMSRIGRERGWSGMSRQQYDMMRELSGALLVGSTQQVIDKILMMYELFNNTRYLAQFTVGSMPHDKVMKSIELFGTIVAPAVNKALGHSSQSSIS